MHIGCTICKNGSSGSQRNYKTNAKVGLRSLASKSRVQELKTIERQNVCDSMSRRNLVALGIGLLSLLSGSTSIEAAGLPPEDKPKLCDDACEKELENVWWDYIAP